MSDLDPVTMRVVLAKWNELGAKHEKVLSDLIDMFDAWLLEEASSTGDRPDDLTADDYDRFFGPPDPEEDRDELARIGDHPASCPVCAWVPEPEEVWPIPAAGLSAPERPAELSG
jgi:hypothetical protein